MVLIVNLWLGYNLVEPVVLLWNIKYIVVNQIYKNKYINSLKYLIVQSLLTFPMIKQISMSIN